ncbi:MAG: cobalamin biosynthesis protein CobQ [Oscillospiraceae bacterium]|nr:cobalamin biosynthesis protein CobQ [Oscillospiraceae bacterium]
MKDIENLINYLSEKKIIIICGHYGAGKTNIALNLAVKLKKFAGVSYTLFDLDMVNPYFRSADNIKELKEYDIDVIAPEFANTNVDISTLPPEVYSAFSGTGVGRHTIIDVGGDANGAVILGMLSGHIKREDCRTVETIYVINKYRNLTGEAKSAAALAESIEYKSNLKITSVINNSNIGVMTTKKEILDSIGYAEGTSALLKVPLLGTSYMSDDKTLDFSGRPEYNIFRIKNYTKKLF